MCRDRNALKHFFFGRAMLFLSLLSFLITRFDVKPPDVSEDADDDKRYVVVALMQKGRRKMSVKAKIQMLAIGFAIYKVMMNQIVKYCLSQARVLIG